MTFKIAAFGALNEDSYKMFGEHLAARGLVMVAAGPYPNALGISQPGRPLRAEALQDENKKRELLRAVASDARAIGAESCDLLSMPCMSMIGFHDGVERALGKKIFRLADAIAAKYKNADRVGVLHMRPAKKRIEEIFGPRAVTPDEARLLAAEEEAKRTGTSAPVEKIMRDVAREWAAQGIRHILFARADAPLAEKGVEVPGAAIDSTFGILAEAIARELGDG
jgi:hypothetical protein